MYLHVRLIRAMHILLKIHMYVCIPVSFCSDCEASQGEVYSYRISGSVGRRSVQFAKLPLTTLLVRQSYTVGIY